MRGKIRHENKVDLLILTSNFARAFPVHLISIGLDKTYRQALSVIILIGSPSQGHSMIGDLLSGLSEEEIRILGDGSKNLELAEGEILFKPGDPASSLYIIYGGEIKITPSNDLNADPGMRLGVGDFFGEVAAIEGRAHTATAVAATPASVVEINWTLLEDLMTRQPQLLRNMTRSLIERMRDTDQRLIGQIQRKAEEHKELVGRISSVLRLCGDVNTLLNWDDLWQRLLDFTLKNLNAERGTVYLLDPSGKRLIGQVIRGDGLSKISLPVGHGIAGMCALDAKPILVTDAHNDPRFASEFDAQTGFSSCAMVCSPFKDAEERVIGVVQLINSTPDSFSAEDLDFLALIADQFSLARQKATAAAAIVDTEVSASVFTALIRLQQLATDQALDSNSELVKELARISLAFDPDLKLTAKPLRFQNFINELKAEAASLPENSLQLQGDMYSGYLTADSAMLKGTIGLILQNALTAGASMIGLSTRDDEEELVISLTVMPPGITLPSSCPGLRLARKAAKLHRGMLLTATTQGGSESISISIALASK